MSGTDWEVVYETNGALLAEILRGLLEAQEISVVLSQEGAGRAYGLTVGTLGRVQMLVPTSDVERAQHILEEYEANDIAALDTPDGELQDFQNAEDVDQPDEDEAA